MPEDFRLYGNYLMKDLSTASYLGHIVTIPVKCKKLDERATIPKKATAYSAGIDLACIEKVVLRPLEKQLIRTGLAFAVPSGIAMCLLPRSGLSYKTDFHVANSPGLIDPDYRGEVKIIAQNLNASEEIVFFPGDRIAQAIFLPFFSPDIQEIQELDSTERGSQGFGSSGM